MDSSPHALREIRHQVQAESEGRHGSPVCSSSTDSSGAYGVSAQQLYQALREFSRLPPRTAAAVNHARTTVSSLDALSRSRPLFPGRWDVARVAAAVSRATIASMPTAAASGGSATALTADDVEARWQLVATALATCPLTTCAQLSAAMTRMWCLAVPVSGWLDDTLLSALARQLPLTLPQDTETATAVVLSLLHDVHLLAAACTGDVSVTSSGLTQSWSAFEALSTDLARFLTGLSASQATPALRSVSTTAQNSRVVATDGKPSLRIGVPSPACERSCGEWLHVVMGCAARQQQPATVEDALAYISAQPRGENRDDTVATAVQHCWRLGWRCGESAVAWARLRSAAFARALDVLARHQDAVKDAWERGAVSPQLRGLLAGAPRHLAANYLEPLAGLHTPPARTVAVLEGLVSASAQLPVLDVETMMRPLRAVRCAAQCIATLIESPEEAGLTLDEYRAVVRPAAVLALREEVAAVAVELLGWAAPLAVDEGWWKRLLGDASHAVRPPVVDTHLPAHGTLFPTLVARWVAVWTGEAALDLLLGSSPPLAELRCVCHALLHQIGPWAAPVLRDPFAYNALFEGLGKLVCLLLGVGDVPLARTYLSALCACVAQRRSKVGLAIYLQTLARFAAVVAGKPLYSHRPALSASHAAWVAVADTLRSLLPVPCCCLWPRHASGVEGLWEPYRGGGSAFEARRGVFAYLAEMPPPDPAVTRATSPLTVVHLRLCDGALIIQRHRLHDPLCEGDCPLPGVVRVSLPVAERVRSVLAHITATMHQNRQQLAHGCDSFSRDLRRTWWAERHRLERALREAVEEVEAALGFARALLCGDLPAPLRQTAWKLTETLVADVEALAQSSMGSGLVEDLPDTEWQAVLYTVMQSLPILRSSLSTPPADVGTAQGADRVSPTPAEPDMAPPSYPLPFSPCCSHATGIGCDACHSTVDAAVDVLVGCLHARFTTLDRTAGVCADPSGQARWDIVATQVRAICDTAVRQLLRHLVAWQRGSRQTKKSLNEAELSSPACSRDSRNRTDCDGAGEDAPRGTASHRAVSKHVDVYRLPREHVHLVLDGSLHLLPWECSDTMRCFSVSRVPSVEYARAAAAVSTAYPLSRVHLAINEPALQRGEGSSSEAGAGHRDANRAVTSRGRFSALLARHTRWTVSEDSADASGQSSSLKESADTSEGDSTPTTAEAGRDHARHSPQPPERAQHDVTTAAASRTPADAAFWRRLIDEEVVCYVYVGHKAGEHLVPRAPLLDRCPPPPHQTAPRPPPLVCLMGCSSAFLAGGEGYEGYGMPWAYLHAGTTSFIGCLWDVTDHDTDRLTRRLLAMLAGDEPLRQPLGVMGGAGDEVTDKRSSCTVGEALAQARLACKLPYLSGSAVVLYGLNTHIQTTACPD